MAERAIAGGGFDGIDAGPDDAAAASTEAEGAEDAEARPPGDEAPDGGPASGA